MQRFFLTLNCQQLLLFTVIQKENKSKAIKISRAENGFFLKLYLQILKKQEDGGKQAADCFHSFKNK